MQNQNLTLPEEQQPNSEWARSYLREHAQKNVRVQDVYDDDQKLQDALCALVPDFEYPDFAHRKISEMARMFA